MAITEGCTRLSLLFDGEAKMKGLGLICGPVLKIITESLEFITTLSQTTTQKDSGQVEVVMQTLALSLQTLGIVVKYLVDRADAQTGQHPMAELLNAMWPLLQAAATNTNCRTHPDVRRLSERGVRTPACFGAKATIFFTLFVSVASLLAIGSASSHRSSS